MRDSVLPPARPFEKIDVPAELEETEALGDDERMEPDEYRWTLIHPDRPRTGDRELEKEKEEELGLDDADVALDEFLAEQRDGEPADGPVGRAGRDVDHLVVARSRLDEFVCRSCSP